MTDFINKIIMIILVFLMLILAPIMINYCTDTMLAKREILNDVDTFIDRVCDSTLIEESDINALYLQCNSHGMVVDVQIQRYVYALTIKDSTGDEKQYTNDYVVDSQYKGGDMILNPSDMIKVTVQEKTISSARKLIYKILRIDEGEFKFSLAGIVG